MKFRIGSYRKIGLLFLLGLASGWLTAQSTTVSTSGVVDHDSSTWSGGTYQIQFSPNPSFPGIGSYVWTGGNLQNNLQFNGSLDNAGAFSVSIPDSTTITPAGSAWNFIICPNATSGCFSTRIPVFGATFSVTTQLNALAAGPRFPVSVSAHGYADVEITPLPLPGGTYYNVTTNFIRVWSGSAWSNIGGGGGSGQVLPSPQFQVGYFPSPGTVATVQGVPSHFTTDAVGNARTLSNDGLRNAYATQTTPTSNNGIANALATPNTSVVAGPDYPAVEGFFSGNSTCLPDRSNWRDAIGCPPPGAGNNTYLWDLRGAEPTSYAYNTDVAGGGAFIDRWVSNQKTQSSGGGYFTIPYIRDFELFGTGKNGFEGGGPDSFEAFQWSFENYSRGIVNVMQWEQQNGSLGDNHLFEFVINNVRGSTDASGEGFNTIRTQLVQNTTPMVTTANTTQAAGATLIPGTLVSNVPFVGDGLYYMDFTKAGPVRHVLSFTQPGGTTAGTMTVDGPAYTPDNFGRTSATINTPKQYYGATTPETFTVTGLTSSITTASTICIADPLYQESAVVTAVGSFSGGTQSITAALRYVHQPLAYVAQGGHTCGVIEMRANQEPGSFPGRQLFRVIGALNSNTIVYSRTVFGNWNSPSGYFSTLFVAAPGATITRNGSNVASVTVSDPSKLFNNIFIIVSGCANSSFNGFFATSTDTGTTLSWPNTGSATTTTCTNAIEIQSQLNGFSVREAQEFPAAEIVNPLDPTTFANNFNISIEHNSNFQATAGDQLENHVYSDTVMGQDHTVYTFRVQTSPSTPSIIHAESYGGQIPEGTTEWRLAYQDAPNNYEGMGGTKPIFNTLLDMGFTTTPFANILHELPPPRIAFTTFSGCLYGCADSRSTFRMFGIPIQFGIYDQTIHQDTGLMHWNTHNATQNFQREESPVGLSLDISDGGTGAGTDYFMIAGETHSQVGGGAGTFTLYDQLSNQFQFTVNGTGGNISHVTQTATGWSIDVPISVPSCTGCSGATGFPITLGSTAVAASSTTTALNGLTVDGVSPTTFGFVDFTGSGQTQLNAKAPLASPTFTGVPAGPTAAPGTNTTQLATTAFVLANGASLPDCTDTSTVSFICTVPISAPSFRTTGTTPGAASLAAGTGSIPALPTNSGGFAAPVTGGTSWLGKLPATITAGIAHFAAPATADGVNESAITSSPVSLTADVSGILPPANGGTGSATGPGTATNCSSSASPAVCGSAAAGSVALPTNVTSSSIVVNTTAVTANSQIFAFSDDSLGTKLGVTCNSTVATLVGGLAITARTSGTSFTISNNVAVAVNPLCVSYLIIN